MARRAWNKKDTLVLIEEYEKNPMLWNTKCEDYRSREIRNEVLSKIASQFNCAGGEVQRKLHNLRNQVSQELNKIEKKKKTGSGTDEVYTSPWPYFDALKFLIPGLINSSTTSNIEAKGEDTHGDEKNDEIRETENNMDEQMRRITPQEKVQKKIDKRQHAPDDDHSRVLKRAAKMMQKESDENDRFGDYVAMELKTLRFDFNRRRLKSAIRIAIARIADEDDAKYFSSVSTLISPHPPPLHYPAQSSSS